MVEYPIFLWGALAFVLLAIIGMVWRERQTTLLIKQLGIVEKLINLDTRRKRTHYFLRVGLIVCLLVVLARPKWGVAEQLIVAEGVGVVWVLDISRSMDAQDINPSRLERAKLTANVVMGNNPNHLFGAVVFARSAFVQFPMTVNNPSAQTMMQSISTESVTNQGTHLIQALETGLDLLDQRMIAHGVMIVLSDGEHNRDLDHLDAVLSDAVARNVPIYTVGYGTHAGAMIPENPQATSFVRDGQDEPVISRLEDALLSQIATTTGGSYQIASVTGDEVAFLQGVIDGMARQEFERRSRLDYIERFPLFVALGLVLLLIDGMIGYGKKHPVFVDDSSHSM